MGDWAFQYDTLNRLTVAAPALNAPNSPSNYRNTVACFGYDGFGNRTVAAFSPSSDCTKDTTATASYNSVNQVTFVSQAAPIATSAPSGFTYDAAGDVVADANNSYAYDGEGRLCAVYNSLTGSKTQYVYDASGGRVAKATFTGTFPAKNTVCAAPGAAAGFTLTAQYLLDQGGDQVTELNGSGAWQHSNVWAGSHLDATYDAKGLHFHLADPLGTRRIQTNIDGQVEESCQSLPFGDNLSCTTTALATADDATEHHFTGKERDTETGNDYFLARYYSSALGRFTTPDWSAKTTPVPYAVFTDPQSLNLYAYVRNNPVIHVDADGHCSGDDCGNITVTAEVIQQPQEIEATSYRNVQGATVEGMIHYTVNYDGNPMSHTFIHEEVTNKTTVNGDTVPAKTRTNSEPTNNKGVVGDTTSISVAVQTDSITSTESSPAVQDMSTNVYSKETTQNLFMTSPSGSTCSVTEMRTLGNADANGKASPVYKVTLQSPVTQTATPVPPKKP